MSAFRKIQDLVYEKNGFYEIEVPTAKIFGQTFPISGGGYFRIIPWVVFKYLFSEYEKENNNFTFYIHPFELTGAVVPLPRGLSFGNKFRFSIGRKTNVERLLRFLELAKSKKYSFKSIHSFITAL